MSIKKILLIFTGWRIVLFLIAFLATKIITTWGGWFPYSETVLEPTKLPAWIWSFGNFDGVHYLRIAQNGYSSAGSQAFFPLYPLIINFLNILPKNPMLDSRVYVDPSYFYIGFILSNLFFIAALYFLYKLFLLDYSKKVSLFALVLLLVFPTSFYFGSIYTESLFLFLIVVSLYTARKRNFLLAGIFALLASATRILGLLLFPVILIELYVSVCAKEIKLKSLNFTKSFLGTFLSPFGILSYMAYLWMTKKDILYFLTVQPSFGAERSSEPFILLPQVVFRYLKIFASIPFFSLQFFNAVNEFFFTLVPLVVLVLLFKKIRLSYWLFTLGCLVLPTLTGTFSSMPRYALMSFLIFPFLILKLDRYSNLLFIGFIALQIILVFLFTRGYWVA